MRGSAPVEINRSGYIARAFMLGAFRPHRDGSSDDGVASQ